MTVGVQTNEIVCQGNGATTLFAFPFLIPAASNAVVTYTAVDGTQTVLTPFQYTISGIGNSAGGTVVYPLSGYPIPSGSSLLIARALPLIQGTSLNNQGPTFGSIETALDYLTMLVQQLASLAIRAITINPTDTTAALPLPVASVRAGKALVFDSVGNPTVGVPVGGAFVSAAMVPVVEAATIADAQAILGSTFSFGDMKYSAVGIEGNGWRLCNGQARPQSDPFWAYMVAQGLAASWKPGFNTLAATYNMPNAQDVVLVGLDGMGGAASPALLTAGVAGFDPTVMLNTGGNQHAQADTLTATSAAVSVATDPGHVHPGSSLTQGPRLGSAGYSGDYNVPINTAPATTGVTVSTAVTTTVTSSLTGESQNIQPSMMAAVLMYCGA